MNTIGYIVQAQKGGAMLLAKPNERSDAPKLLYFGNHATIFPSRKSAQKAIEWTIQDRPTFETEFGKLSILRVERESEGK